MSIIINGNNNVDTISKDLGSYVKVMPKLYLNGKEITASGGGGSTPTEQTLEIQTCNNYAASKYSNADKVIVNITNWTRVEPTSGYYEVNANGEYNVSQFAGYKGICVTKEKEEPDDTIEVKTPMEVTFGGSSHSTITSKTLTSTSYEDVNVDNDIIDFNNYNVRILSDAFKINWTCNTGTEGEGSGVAELFFLRNNWDGSSTEATSTIETPNYIVTLKGILTLDSNNKKFTCALSYTASHIPSMPETGLSFGYGIPSGTTLTITQTPKVTASALSLRQSEVDTTISTYENLVVNNDALIQGDLNVDGYINDLKWHWDEIVLESPNSIIGHGLLARLSQCSFTINDSLVNMPELQLSPGAIYTTDTYTIQWTADGRLLVDQNIGNFTGTVKILRYE